LSDDLSQKQTKTMGEFSSETIQLLLSLFHFFQRFISSFLISHSFQIQEVLVLCGQLKRDDNRSIPQRNACVLAHQFSMSEVGSRKSSFAAPCHHQSIDQTTALLFFNDITEMKERRNVVLLLFVTTMYAVHH